MSFTYYFHDTSNVYLFIFFIFSGREDSYNANIVSGEKSTIFPNGSLILHEVSKLDEGLYKCNASNGVGNPLEATAALKVIGMKE